MDKFATYFRDSATGLDYADQRFYASSLSRFMTADPVEAADLTDPGSWNQYAYVGGDPINYVDSTGEFRIPVISGIGSFFGQLLGLINNAGPFPSVKLSPFDRQKVHKETTDRWVNELALAVAAAATRQNEDPDKPKRYPQYLAPKLGQDICSRVGKNPILREVTYELYDD